MKESEAGVRPDQSHSQTSRQTRVRLRFSASNVKRETSKRHVRADNTSKPQTELCGKTQAGVGRLFALYARGSYGPRSRALRLAAARAAAGRSPRRLLREPLREPLRAGLGAPRRRFSSSSLASLNRCPVVELALRSCSATLHAFGSPQYSGSREARRMVPPRSPPTDASISIRAQLQPPEHVTEATPRPQIGSTRGDVRCSNTREHAPGAASPRESQSPEASGGGGGVTTAAEVAVAEWVAWASSVTREAEAEAAVAAVAAAA